MSGVDPTADPSHQVRRLEEVGQTSLAKHLANLAHDEANRLAQDLASLDLAHIKRLAEKAKSAKPTSPRSVEPLPQVTRGANPGQDAEAARLGWDLLKAGKVAAFTVAGGQGTRLGHPGPKGTFAATPLTEASLFQVFAEKLLAFTKEGAQTIPWYIMTSPGNHAETLAHFQENKHFGLDANSLMFFQQGTLPAVDDDGQLLLAKRDELFRSPDGHGGSLRALHVSGALDDMRGRGVEQIFYFQVDNPLVAMCDPAFLGYHVKAQSEFSSKAVPKRDPEEKVGVLCNIDDQPGVIEYSDLSEDLRTAKDDDGKLRYRAGNIAVHLLSRGFVERINQGEFALPFHNARKQIPTIDADGNPTKKSGIKFETFVFDGLPLAKETFLMEVPRADEFSPIKNREGQDSPSTSKTDQSELYVRWLEQAGVQIPNRDADGRIPWTVEISPLFAFTPEQLRKRRHELPDRLAEDLYLGPSTAS